VIVDIKFFLEKISRVKFPHFFAAHPPWHLERIISNISANGSNFFDE
jgi:hypothetical protein